MLFRSNIVYSYDADPFTHAAEALPRSVGMVLAILLGEHPRFLFVPRAADGDVAAQVRAMGWELTWVLAKLAAFVLLAAALLLLLWRALRPRVRSEEHTSELQSLMRIPYAVFCLKKKTHRRSRTSHTATQSDKLSSIR